jgi:hypothetical protein
MPCVGVAQTVDGEPGHECGFVGGVFVLHRVGPQLAAIVTLAGDGVYSWVFELPGDDHVLTEAIVADLFAVMANPQMQPQ